ncbi:MAG: SurA N-terminal domain-containing protein [Parvibaculum sp.]|uniref:peptidylprolyl isomerase n=1 Tax=Parvibaculum sp. TaxID=2024848 RepID=UPI001DB5F401|nr:SurA N-terminal domain-containing protein [Parvibaculum sp.]MBX3487800.1 SurA N-terminal domain-containing protein [Parvibaculum sp.]MBX3497217.1 SurA N-terminal domain-containing protein [Parvibaculum sp.]MCW5729037.1 SurA N-terminal domain-containing protein [Parvibaculum sp.]
MLDAMRRNASGWVAKVLIGLLVASFAVWGINDIFTGFGGDTVATVGDEKVDAIAFQRELRAEMNQFGQRLGQPVTLEMAQRFGIDRMALSRLMSLAALDGATRQMGLTVGDDTVGNDIVTDPALQSAFGTFDRDLFRQALQNQGITEERFVEQRRKYLARRQLIDVIDSGVAVPDTMIAAVGNYQEQSRTVGYVILPPSLVADVGEPDEETVQSVYQAGASAFTLPETRDFSIMVLEPEDITHTVTIDDDELAIAFEQRRGDYDKPERRDVVQIPFGTEAAAREAHEKLVSGTPVSEIVAGLGLTAADVESGMLSRDRFLSDEVAAAAFATAKGAFSEPVRGPLGWVVVQVRDIEPETRVEFETVKDELRAALELELARDQVYDIQNAIEDARAGGASLEDVARTNNLTVRQIASVTANGKTRNGDDVELPDLPNLLRNVYETEIGDAAPPQHTDDGYYWVQVDAIDPPHLKPLEEVRDEVVTLWRQQKRDAALIELAETLAARANKGESFETIAGELGRAVLTAPGMKRNLQSDTFSRQAVAKAFATGEGRVTWGPVGLGEGLVLMHIREVHDLELDPASDAYARARENVLDSIKADLIQTFVAGYQEELGYNVNTVLLRQLTATDTGQ